ncbi:rRNA bioproteinsis protein rrp5 [Purpureocillium takamizusanense]|uniref:rRNA biogenesis protein RRP5 n=1 Tax=Purpureocillium takamizusanense TaxID=2060973 RepID=A0A9Q8QBT5_9HYPO|nr:rRNA biogenesis protein rrp5 [Purpureocillium takamizusanense]UNI16377.1 rRNA bioproteinsis protein rrp5 [Purpureocillium takamizusanense]
MSNLKRKEAPGGPPPSKTAKKLKEARPSKNDATAKDATPASKPSKKPAEPKAPVVSLLKDDEPIFPRGGGSVLTPLEQKQIQLEAKADAMRDDEFDTGGKAQKKKKRKVSLKSDGKPGSSKKNTEGTVKVESLNFKKLVKGSLVLGQVTRINRLDLEIALPNNLAGRVSIVAISEQLTDRLQSNAVEKDDGDGDDDEESSDESNVDLKSLFAVGQYLRLYVVSTLDESAVTGKARRKINLSLRPAETNEGLDKDDLVPNSTVMAAVVSVEDRGCVMDIGISGLRAFLPTGEIDPSIDRDRLQPGSVFLCHVTGQGKGKVVQLSLLQKALGNVKAVPTEATTISTFLPGTAVDVLVSHADRRGLAGKVMGSLDVTADLVHSGVGPNDTNLEEACKVGSKIKARVICNFPTAKDPKLGISLLPHITSLSRMYPAQDANNLPTVVLPVSSLVEKCTVRHVESEIGLFVDTGVAGLSGFVHISRVKDGKVDALYQTSGPYQVGSVHKGRVIGYSEMDGIFHISFEKTILEQQYIRLEDVPVGAVVNCEIERLVIKEDGVAGLILKLAEGINGFVPDRHMSDIRLQHPEKKFREGMKVKARVLSTNPAKRTMRLTLKKTLVNSDAPPIKSYNEVSVGMQVLGTIVKLQPNGAHVKFYGPLRGFLPVSEMSEAYIRDPNEHFRVGQVVNVYVLDVDPDQRRLVVSCKDPGAFGLEKQTALKNIKLGDIVSGKVTQKTEDQVFVELADSQLKAILPVGHLTDNKSASKVQFSLKRISTGQTLSNLAVIDKNDQRRAIILTQKASLVEAAKDGKLPSTFEEVKIGSVLSGFVRNITQSAVFVQFSGSLHALLPRARLPADAQSLPDFGLQKYQSIEVKVVSTIPELRRVMVAPSSAPEQAEKPKRVEKAPAPEDGLKVGSIVQASITSVKQTQLNVQLVGTGVQGRIDVSQVFDKWDDIPDPKDPLDKFRKKQQLKVKVIGVHDAKDHRFLPLSHRSAHSVLELSAKPSDLKSEVAEPLALESIKVGETHVAFVNNVTPQYLWVNLSPNVRGRVSAMEASDDSSLLNDLHAHFPIGSALRVKVTSVDTENKHLDLSARSSSSSESITWASLKPNMFLPGRITKVNERQVLIKLSETVSGPVHLPDMVDNFDDIDTSEYKKNDIVRVSVVEVDAPNKRLRLSLRPSRIMSSALPVADKEISSFSQISSGDIVRGFVKNVADKGLFVLLGGQVTALVKIANLSDRFLKEWKDQFQIDQLVKGRVIAVDAALRQVELSLKASMVEEDYTPPMTFKDIKEGQVVTGKVRKVEEFGAFILVDNSANVSGLCHRSQMADKAVKDATKLYKEGDVVKAKVLEVDADKRRISFGLKPSLFDDEDSDMGSDAGAALEDESDEDVEMDEGALLKILGTDNMDDSDSDSENEEVEDDQDEGSDDDEEMEDAPSASASAKGSGLGLGKKSAWAEDPFDEPDAGSDDGEQIVAEKKKRRRKGEVQVDKTAELDAHGPQTSSDYERLLLGQPDSSALWIAYMSFQMQVSDLSKAREVAERAIKSINIREETEKLNVWVAYLNLEVAYGSKQTVEDVFKRACQYNDEQTVHEKLASNYIGLNKQKDADALFETMVKKFGAKSPKVWTNYAHFLHHTNNDPSRARALLPRATQQLDKRHHQAIISGFAALEFMSDNGEPERGRTMFEGLLSTWPKKGDLWSQLLDLETRRGAEADQAAVRDVFERRTRVKGLKPQQAERWFRRWAEWEEKLDPKGRERVMAKAQDWAAQFKSRKEADAAAAAEAADEEMEE